MGDFNLPAIDWDKCSFAPGQPLPVQQACQKLLDFVDKNFLTQTVKDATRGGNTLDLIFTNKVQDVCSTGTQDTILSDHRLVELTLTYNPLKGYKDEVREVDPHSYRAVDVHSADYDCINERLAKVDWDKMKENVGEDKDGTKFLTKIQETVLDAVLDHSPHRNEIIQESAAGLPNRTRHPQIIRERRRLKQKRRKIQARIRAVQANNPTSPAITKLKQEVALVGYELQQNILRRLQKREANAVDKIKSNPRFFYSFAKRFAKTII